MTPLRSIKFAAVAALAISASGMSASAAGTFTFAPLTGDADSGISNSKTYTHAIDIAGGGTTINGVPFVAGADSGPGYSSTGLPNNFPSTGTNATGGVGTLLSSFRYSDGNTTNTEVLTLTGLTQGQRYTTAFYNAGYGGAGNRIEKITAGDGGVTVFDENYLGNQNGNRLRYSFVAPSTSFTYTFEVNKAGQADSFHQYGFSNEVSTLQSLNLYNTGVSAANSVDGTNANVLTDNTTNAAGFTVKTPSGSDFVATKAIFNQGAYYGGNGNADGGNSRFVNNLGDGAAAVEAGVYTYRTTVDLTGYDPSTAELSGYLYADDKINGILVNGVAISTNVAGGGFGQGNVLPFSIVSGFTSGVNTIDFLSENGGPGANPAGFRLDQFRGIASPVPEPASIALLGLAGVAAMGRRRRA